MPRSDESHLGLKSSAAAASLGVSLRTLKRLVRESGIAVPRSRGGWMSFDYETLERLRVFVEARRDLVAAVPK